MVIQHCTITLHEPLFHATREVGRLYETGRYLHNYALAYAFGLVHSPWYHAEQVPHYAEDLNPLVSYITPAQPEALNFSLSTFKYGEEILHVEMAQATRNTPSFGRAKEITAESRFSCFVISPAPIAIPRWIRLGKWHSKAQVEAQIVEDVTQRNGSYVAAAALNPLDVAATDWQSFDIISMPPASLVANARCHGRHYAFGEASGLLKYSGLPIEMRYRVPSQGGRK